MECCRWAFEPRRAENIRGIAGEVDWPAFFVMVDRHRIAGLAWNALHSLDIEVPKAVHMQLSTRASAIAAHGLRAAAESARLSAALQNGSIPHLFIKGLAVGALAYGSPFIKHSWDIDVLVDDGRIEKSAALLQQLGYDLVFPSVGPDWRRLARWHDSQKDSAWRHRSLGIMVELHSRLADNRVLIPGIGLASPRQQVAITDTITLPTLANDEMFAHLCVHGASSAWFRLKWISDLAALLVRWSADVDRLYRRSQELGAGRSAGQALLLAHRLFDAGIDERLRQTLEADASNRWLADVAVGQLLGPEPGARRFGTGAIHASQLMLLPGLRFKAAEASRQIAAATSNLFN